MTSSQTTQLPPRRITAGDHAAMYLVVDGLDISELELGAEVRRRQSTKALLIGAWVIESKLWDEDATRTIIGMHLLPSVTRAIGDAGAGYWDLQVQFPDIGPRTIVGQELLVELDVTR